MRSKVLTFILTVTILAQNFAPVIAFADDAEVVAEPTAEETVAEPAPEEVASEPAPLVEPVAPEEAAPPLEPEDQTPLPDINSAPASTTTAPVFTTESVSDTASSTTPLVATSTASTTPATTTPATSSAPLATSTLAISASIVPVVTSTNLALTSESIAVNIPGQLNEAITIENKFGGSNFEMLFVGDTTVFGEQEGEAIIFKNVASSTDLKYDVNEKGIKEYLILHDPTHPSQFKYELNASQYDFVQVTPSLIDVYKRGFGGNELYRLYSISAPYME